MYILAERRPNYTNPLQKINFWNALWNVFRNIGGLASGYSDRDLRDATGGPKCPIHHFTKGA
jgi:hypothetical protein